MNWHTRYLQQAAWTRDLRTYLFEKAGLADARRVLEVGCGTGAVLRGPSGRPWRAAGHEHRAVTIAEPENGRGIFRSRSFDGDALH